MSFVGPLISVLEFWWQMPWVLMPGWILSLMWDGIHAKNNGNVCDYLRELQKPCRMLLTLYINHCHYNCPLPDSYNGVQCSFCQRDNFNLWCKFRRILNMKNYSILVSCMFYCWRESGSPKQYSEVTHYFLEVQASHSGFYYPDVPPLSFQHHLLKFKSMRHKPV